MKADDNAPIVRHTRDGREIVLESTGAPASQTPVEERSANPYDDVAPLDPDHPLSKAVLGNPRLTRALGLAFAVLEQSADSDDLKQKIADVRRGRIPAASLLEDRSFNEQFPARDADVPALTDELKQEATDEGSQLAQDLVAEHPQARNHLPWG